MQRDLARAPLVKPVVNNRRHEPHDRHGVGAHGVTVRTKHACEVRQSNEGEDVGGDLQEVLPRNVGAERSGRHANHAPNANGQSD